MQCSNRSKIIAYTLKNGNRLVPLENLSTDKQIVRLNFIFVENLNYCGSENVYRWHVVSTASRSKQFYRVLYRREASYKKHYNEYF